MNSTVLSIRDRDVVRLIAKGHRLRVIAERLGISYYTVKNHLSSAFRKLEGRRPRNARVHGVCASVAAASRRVARRESRAR